MRLIQLREVKARTGLSRSVILKLVDRGQFPRPTKLYEGGRVNGWVEEEVEAYIEARAADRIAAQ